MVAEDDELVVVEQGREVDPETGRGGDVPGQPADPHALHVRGRERRPVGGDAGEGEAATVPRAAHVDAVLRVQSLRQPDLPGAGRGLVRHHRGGAVPGESQQELVLGGRERGAPPVGGGAGHGAFDGGRGGLTPAVEAPGEAFDVGATQPVAVEAGGPRLRGGEGAVQQGRGKRGGATHGASLARWSGRRPEPPPAWGGMRVHGGLCRRGRRGAVAAPAFLSCERSL